MDTDSQPKEFQRVQELWFEDGNIVVRAETSQFRVYRGFLATRSPVFQDMFSFPQPLDSELVDGCPLVVLPDPAPHVIVFLRAIFDSSFFKPFPFPTAYNIIVGCLRLSHKYGVDYLRREALIHFSSGFDTKLSRWDAEAYGAYNLGDDTPVSRIISWGIPPDIGYNASVIHIIREVDALWLLPLAFYSLSATSSTDIGSDIFSDAGCNSVPTKLSDVDRAAFLRGHGIQCLSVATDILRFLYEPVEIDGCGCPEACSQVRLRAIASIREVIRANPSRPLDIWGPNEWEWLDDACLTCLTALKKTHQEAKEEFWDKLPGIYGLPPWEELQKMQVAAIGSELF
ncbi:hypothetical protein DFH07DRAFT_940030 [Mycena maculata]|uniref:BTB domain-containing protein n=1 Tax=Mycena maculata TaxID=230809 RepID=A0AAD7J9H6_9AGAR|nr:hypothetical protein DFH07DRAFT_940030 [Mycena maculata]